MMNRLLSLIACLGMIGISACHEKRQNLKMSGASVAPVNGATSGTPAPQSTPNGSTAVPLNTEVKSSSDLGVISGSLMLKILEKTMTVASVVLVPEAMALPPDRPPPRPKPPAPKPTPTSTPVPEPPAPEPPAPEPPAPEPPAPEPQKPAPPKPAPTGASSEEKQEAFDLFEGSQLVSVLKVEIGDSKYDELIHVHDSFSDLLKSQPNASVPKELSTQYKFKLNCRSSNAPVVIGVPVLKLLNSSSVGVICHGGKAYFGDIRLPKQGADESVTINSVTNQIRVKAGNRVILVGGLDEDGNQKHFVSVLVFDASGTFKIISGQALKMNGLHKKPVYLTNPRAKYAGLDSLGKKAILIANVDDQNVVLTFELLNLTTLTVTALPATVKCDKVIGLFEGLTCE